jgi:hypothetical protein
VYWWRLRKSNLEQGEGYGDILIETPESIGMIVELKYAKDNNIKTHAEEALAQIEGKQYEARLYDDGMEKIVSKMPIRHLMMLVKLYGVSADYILGIGDDGTADDNGGYAVNMEDEIK